MAKQKRIRTENLKTDLLNHLSEVENPIKFSLVKGNNCIRISIYSGVEGRMVDWGYEHKNYSLDSQRKLIDLSRAILLDQGLDYV